MSIITSTTPSVSFAKIRAEREKKAALESQSGLFARIKKSSEYTHQDSGVPFPVAFYTDCEYIVHGGPGGRYRLDDVDLYWSNSSGQLFKC